LSAAGVEARKEWKLDGVDLLPYLSGKKDIPPHDALYWRFGAQWAIRHGDWKLVAGNGGDMQGELFNLAVDKDESKNLAAAEEDKVRELKSMWDEWNAEQQPPSAPKEKPNRAQRQRRRAATNG
jgi:arylsulfatase A-like enzyme